jgi:hypothetical protein
VFLRRLREYLKFLKSLFLVNSRLLWGMWRLTKMPHPAITMFGSARTMPGTKHAEMARGLAKKLASDGYSIITGGGPGIMEAANEGAIDYLIDCKINGYSVNRRVSAGIGLVRLNMEKLNPYVQENIVMSHFFSRKWLLVRYSVGFVVFPGGFGTLDEMFEVITLIQTERMSKLPLILMDKDYWIPIIEWCKTRAIRENYITDWEMGIITLVTDDVEEAFQVLCKNCANVKRSP